MKQVINETFQYMWRSEKNRLFMFMMTVITLAYSLFVLPNISGENEVDLKDLEREMSGNVVQYEEALEKGLIVPSALTGTTSYFQERTSYVKQRQLLTALEHGDAKRYISINYRPENRTSSQTQSMSQFANRVFAYQEEQPYQQQKYNHYIEEIDNLSFHTVHERTSLQQLHLFLIGLGPILLLIGLIFLISDVHTKDLDLTTMKLGVPMKWQKYLLIQGLSAWAFVGLFYLFLCSVFFIVTGLQFGFGSLSLPVGQFQFIEPGSLNPANYQLMSIGQFLFRAFPYLLLFGYLMVRLNTFLSIWTKNSIITMFTGIFMIVSQKIYYSNEFLQQTKMDHRYFPQTYIEFGKILTGRFEQITEIDQPTIWIQGLIILLVTIFITELLVYLSSKKMHRQKYVF